MNQSWVNNFHARGTKIDKISNHLQFISKNVVYSVYRYLRFMYLSKMGIENVLFL